ncbi:MAG: sulfite exporter TauE/SafE family protein [Eubacteriales bacterium]|nr:sulfite exporter TauE/SafE family protein [Eubacteriales bacterium]
MFFPVAAAAVVVSYFFKGLCGFGNTLIFSTAMSFFSNTVSITPVEAVLGLPSTSFIAWKNRKDLHWKIILPVAAIMVAGCIPGVLVLKNSSPVALKIVFGLIVVALGVEMLLRERAGKRKGSKLVLGLIGLLAGIMSGLFGVGALMTAYMSRTTETSGEFRGNICMVFLLNDLTRLVLYIATGVLTQEILLTVLKLAPFMLLGLAAGNLLADRINEQAVKRTITLLLILSGVSLVVTNLL